jgi:serine/threonine-protein kinase HipA
MKSSGKVYIKNVFAGIVWESEEEFGFTYDEKYLTNPVHGPVSRTLPLRKEPFTDKTMIPFFDGLIPEGWFLNIATKNWKLNVRDRMGLLIKLCHDCIGAVSIQKIENE